MSWNPNQGQDPNQPAQPEGYPQQPAYQPGGYQQQTQYGSPYTSTNPNGPTSMGMDANVEAD